MSECPKPRFKGVENFLRRLAFNLGNSPSQTEVKIISCIPIDVTDLQQKIFDLERLVTRFQKPPAIVHTALCEPGTSRAKEIPLTNDISNINTVVDKKTSSYENNKMPECRQNVEQNATRNAYLSQAFSANSILSDNNKTLRKNFFKKPRKKSPKKPKKPKSQFVFYAQTDNSPFKARGAVEKKIKTTNFNKETKKRNDLFLDDVIRKQYEPLLLSGESDFSSPVCRDLEYSPLQTNASDICSCCRLDFLNIDVNNAESKGFDFTPTFCDQIRNQNAYYDSSLYDLVPVKEAPPKAKKNIEMLKKPHRNEFNFYNYNDNTDRPYVYPVQVDYRSVMPMEPQISHSIPRRALTRKTYRRNPPSRRVDLYNVANGITQEFTSNSTRIECGRVYRKPINKLPEQPKTIEVKKQTVTYNNANTATLNNIECQTTTTTTQNAEIDSIPLEDKSEETLNQIKTILQSVLTEVKTNRNTVEKIKKDAVVQKGTSFSHIPGSSRLLNSFSYSPYNTGHNGPSYSHPMNSGQMFSGVPYSGKCMHNFPVFIQTPGRLPCANYYKQTSHISKPSSHQPPRKAASAATNTDEHNQETAKLIKEIYKSIALNIDMPKKDTSASNCSSAWKRSSRTSTKSSYRTDKSVSAKHDFVNSMAQSVYRRDAMNSVPLTLTPYSSNTFSNKMTSNTVSVQSHRMSLTDTDRRLRQGRFGQYLDTTQESHGISSTDTDRRVKGRFGQFLAMPEMQSNGMSTTDTDRRPKNDRFGRYLDATLEMPSEESTVKTVKLASHLDRRSPSASLQAESSEETDEDEKENVYEMSDEKAQKKERNNLFTKMIKSVKLFKNRKRKSQKSKVESEDDVESDDSDDYQTVYSQQVEQQQARKPIQIQIGSRRIPHSKVSYSRQMRGRNQEKLRRLSMEQEYRRQWNEQLAFKEQQQRQRRSTDPSERSYAASKSSKLKQSCLARPAMVEQSIPIHNTMFQDVLTTLPQQRMGPQNKRAAPPKGLSWFKRRMRCGEHIVRSLIVDN